MGTAGSSCRGFLIRLPRPTPLTAPVNALGYLRAMFTVDNLDDTLARLQRRGAELVDRVVQYQDSYRLCYIRGPKRILIGLAEELHEAKTRSVETM